MINQAWFGRVGQKKLRMISELSLHAQEQRNWCSLVPKGRHSEPPWGSPGELHHVPAPGSSAVPGWQSTLHSCSPRAQMCFQQWAGTSVLRRQHPPGCFGCSAPRARTGVSGRLSCHYAALVPVALVHTVGFAFCSMRESQTEKQRK